MNSSERFLVLTTETVEEKKEWSGLPKFLLL